MKKRKHLRILAATLALLPVLSGCGAEPAENQGEVVGNQGSSANQESSAPDMETIYLRTEARSYDDNGEVIHLETWKYDDRGMLLCYEEDEEWEETFDEKDLVYVCTPIPIDGEVDTTKVLEYDDRGNLSFYKHTSGEQTVQQDRFEWQYEGDRIMGYEICPKELGPGMVTAGAQYDFTYDENGNLTQIYSCNPEGEKNYLYTMEYDEQGRLTREIRYQWEGDIVYDFGYSETGMVEAFAYSRKIHANTPEYDEEAINEMGRDAYEYTKDGQLQLGRGYECEYDDMGRLISQKNGEQEFTFTYDGNTPVESSGDYVYDENGCLIQAGNTHIQYQAFTLSKEDAARCRRQQQMYLNSPVDYDWSNYGIGLPDGYVIPSPLDPRLLVWPVTEYNR